MVLLVVFFYFLLIAGAAVLFAFPEARVHMLRVLGSALGATGRNLSRTFKTGSSAMHRTGHALSDTLSQGESRLRANRRLTVTAMLLVIVPPAIALITRGPTVFSFVDDVAPPDRQIAVLLEGEQLVPPPPLPPEFFTTREVELVRPGIVFADRNWARLDPDFIQKLLHVMKIMKEQHGYEMVLIEGYRSPERQTQLAALGSNVTRARAYSSYHQYGLAADCAFVRGDKIVISELDPWTMRGYALYGQVAESTGLHWGGRWKMRDLGHVELARKGVLGSSPPA